MKKRQILLTSIFFIFTFSLLATTPEVSSWFRNISEGMGADESGYLDRYPEIAVSGDAVHTLWYTHSDPRSIQYRRSQNGGSTWDQKKIIFQDLNIRYDARYAWLAVSGNYVHIVAINGISTREDYLLYFRSTDGGATFAPPDTIYTSDVDLGFARIAVQGPNVYIMYTYDCHYCGTEQILYLSKSNDNGESFQERVEILKDDPKAFLYMYDMQIDGNNLYIPAFESVNVWYEYDYNYHLFISNDGGASWRSEIISIPSADGWHHPFALQNSNDGEVPKIACDDGKVWVTWSGLDENDVPTVFNRTSHDAGMTWFPINKVNAQVSVSNIHRGSSTITGRAYNAYIAWLNEDSRVYVAQSIDGGMTWLPPREFTEPSAAYTDKSWYPRIYMDPLSNDAFVISSGPLLGRIPADGSEIHTMYLGNYDYRQCKYPQLGIDAMGRMHMVFSGGGNWVATGVFTDDDILYRRIDPGYSESGTDNKVLMLEFQSNDGDGSGESIADNLTIPAGVTNSMTSEMTIEFWLRPALTNTNRRIITQNHSSTWAGSIGDPPALQIWTLENGQIAAGIVTETGAYVLWSDKNLIPKYWNHLALVYANNEAADNYKLYLNGQMVAQTTASGDLINQNIPITVGANSGGFGGYLSTAYRGAIDELRFWSKARTPEALDSMKFKQLIGNEDNLTAYYNFNTRSEFGEVYDVSGNGYNAFLMYLEELEESNIHEIGAQFSYTQQTRTFYFNQQSQVAEKFMWDFGDGNTSDQANPQHTYNLPGVYTVCMTALGDEMIGSWCEDVTIYGVQRYLPHNGGNAGEVTLRIYGGGLSDQTNIHMARDGHEQIEGYNVTFFEPDLVMASFHLIDKAIGEWDVVVTNNGTPATLEQKFTIRESEGPQTWANVSTPKRTRPYRWESVYITYGNDGDNDALLTPLHIFIPEPQGELEVDFVGIQQERLPGLEDISFDSMEYIPKYVELDTFGYNAIKGRLYIFHVPFIQAHSSKTFKIRVKTPVTIAIQVYAGDPLISAFDEALIRDEDPNYTKVAVCIGAVIADAASDVLGEFVDDLSGCVLGVYKTWFNQVKDPKNKPTMSDAMLNWSLTAFDCGLKVGKLVAKNNPYFKAYQLISNAAKIYSHANNLVGCLKPLLPDGIRTATLFTYPATDPNAIYGPEGFGEANYIAPITSAQYTITFENLSDAVAPAAEVYVVDTLDVDFFDQSDFELGAFGFGDTVIIPPPGQREYAIDIDMRPNMDLFVRVTGEITNDGVAKWYFAALMPDSMVVPADPLIGFLPPNINSPEGEGFVSYRVGVRAGIIHDNVIENQASIVFDYNKPIKTNIHRITFDRMAPECEMWADAPLYGDTTFQIHIEGNDEGAGVSHYLIYLSHNDSAYQFLRYLPAQSNSFDFIGEPESNYKLYAIAIDSVGHEEEIPVTADVNVDVVVGVDEWTNIRNFSIYPSPSRGEITLDFYSTSSSDLIVDIMDIQGRMVQNVFDGPCAAGPMHFRTHIDTSPGIYLIRIKSDHGIIVKRFIIQN